MNKPIFGELSLVDIRTVWPREDQDFTPWLAQPENLEQLGEVLNLDLELEETEVSVGPYFADIYASDRNENRAVVIENQFGRTDHDHLGKLLTYGSVLGAEVIVWIAERFTEEHQQAIDWLNDHTTLTIEFYAIAVELWKIDNSVPAVRFNTICEPNNVVKRAAARKAATELSQTQEVQLSFWTDVSEALISCGELPSTQTPQAQTWFDVKMGRSGVHLKNICNVQQSRVAVKLHVGEHVSESLFPKLQTQKEQIEEAVGSELEWDWNSDRKSQFISLERGVNFATDEGISEAVSWMTETIRKFRRVFRPLIQD